VGWRKRFEDAGKYLQRNDGTGGKYEFESRADRMSRRLKGVQGPYEHRDEMTEYIESRSGVEAYVEPKTVMHPLSVVLVAGDGEHHASRSRTTRTSASWPESARSRSSTPRASAIRSGCATTSNDRSMRRAEPAQATRVLTPTERAPDLLERRVEVRGFEPLTSAVRGQRSTGLSYTPREFEG
jgi:hypothetical protein